MFKIEDGREEFYQWDLDRRLIVDDASIVEVHFCNRTDECSLVCEVYDKNGERLVNVPNILLQTDWRINVYAYDGQATKHSTTFKVNRRSKPADYVYTETEVLRYEDLEKRIATLEKSGGSGNAVGVEYIEQLCTSEADGGINIIECKLTDGTVTQFDIRNGSQGSTPEKGVDYFTEEDKQELVNDVIAAQPNPVYELLETITIEENSEVSAWVRDDIACDKIMIKIVCPAEHANGKISVGVGYGGYTIGMLYQAGVSNATNENHSLMELFAEDGYWVCQQYLRTNKANSGTMGYQPRYYKVYSTKVCPYLNKYTVTNIDNSLPVGTVITVYGVKRYEN